MSPSPLAAISGLTPSGFLLLFNSTVHPTFLPFRSWNMVVKFLRFHMIPWYCFFNNMGSHISCVHPPHPHSDNGIYSGKTAAASRTVKLIRADGSVQVYHRPIMAGELMLEFPKHLVCHADSFFIGKKVPPLSETDRLKLGHKYFLLPSQFFQSVLTFATIASFASVDNEDKSLSKKKEMVKKLATTCKPFDIQKSPSGSMQIRVSDEFISKLMEEGRVRDHEEGDQDCMLNVKGKNLVCTTPQLQKDYSQLVEFRKSSQWRPKLETIREKDRKKLKYARLKMNIKKNSKIKSHSKLSDHKQVKIHKLEKEEEKKLKKAKKLESKEKMKERKMEKKLEKNKRRLERKKEKNVLDEKETGSKLVHRTVPPPAPPPPPPIRTFSSKIKWNMKKKKVTKLVHSIPTPPPLPPPPKIRTLSSKIKWKKKKKKDEKKETKLVPSVPPPPPPPPPPPSIRTFSSKIKWRKKKPTSL